MVPDCRTETGYLDTRLRLFREMLAVTRDLDDALTIAEVTSDDLRIIDSLVDARESVISRIKELDARVKCQRSPSDCKERDIRAVMQELMTLQERIDRRLEQHKMRTQDRIRDIRKRRTGLSGYYDKSVASQPRYVDTKK